jgi:hypothetical protein
MGCCGQRPKFQINVKNARDAKHKKSTEDISIQSKSEKEIRAEKRKLRIRRRNARIARRNNSV